MKYQLRDYQGNEILVTPEQAQKIAEVSELIEITVGGQTHYLNPKNIASIKPTQGREYPSESKRIEAPDYRGRPSSVKDEMRKRWGKRGVDTTRIDHDKLDKLN